MRQIPLKPAMALHTSRRNIFFLPRYLQNVSSKLRIYNDSFSRRKSFIITIIKSANSTALIYAATFGHLELKKIMSDIFQNRSDIFKNISDLFLHALSGLSIKFPIGFICDIICLQRVLVLRKSVHQAKDCSSCKDISSVCHISVLLYNMTPLP